MDIVGYRRNGHNEQDDPSVTLPLTYSIIEHHPTVLELYEQQLEVGSHLWLAMCSGVPSDVLNCTAGTLMLPA